MNVTTGCKHAACFYSLDLRRFSRCHRHPEVNLCLTPCNGSPDEIGDVAQEVELRIPDYPDEVPAFSHREVSLGKGHTKRCCIDNAKVSDSRR